MAAQMQTLAEAGRWYDAWLRDAALPLWAGAGVDPAQGFFQEALTVDGRPHPAARRSRVQARQVFVFATCAKRGYGASLSSIARRGFEGLVASYGRPDGLFINSVNIDGTPLDQGVDIYEQAFALLAMAALHAVDPTAGDLPAQAERTLHALQDRRVVGGGLRESGAHPYQANCHMHLFESSLAWEEAGVASWVALSDELAELALGKFIDGETGVLREFFDSQWRPLEGEGGLIEPGHHFEWAWLLERWGRARDDRRARDTARRLYANGLRGVDPERQVAMNALWEDFSIRDGAARLWPQTEHLKATLFFGDDAEVLRAAQGLAKYLDVPARGAWRDKMQADGSFLDEPSPATSFYHLLTAVLELQARAG
jgi:mannose-1-phosphate guanylyltransferase / mannose-6-phosphate isomerase